MKSWKIISTTLCSLMVLFTTSCDQSLTEESLPKPEKEVGLHTNYDLDAVTIYAQYTYDSNLFNDIYAMSVGNDYHATSNPYTALTSEYAGENLDAIPGLLAKIIAMINKELISKYGFGLKDEEIAFLKEKCTIKQSLAIWGILGLSSDYQKKLLATTFNGEPVDGGFANAMTHAFMSNRMAIALGSKLGAEYMAAHEARETGLNTQMDAKNNAIGNSYDKPLSESTLIAMAEQRMLWTIQNGVLGQYAYIPKTPRNPYQP